MTLWVSYSAAYEEYLRIFLDRRRPLFEAIAFSTSYESAEKAVTSLSLPSLSPILLSKIRQNLGVALPDTAKLLCRILSGSNTPSLSDVSMTEHFTDTPTLPPTPSSPSKSSSSSQSTPSTPVTHRSDSSYSFFSDAPISVTPGQHTDELFVILQLEVGRQIGLWFSQVLHMEEKDRVPIIEYFESTMGHIDYFHPSSSSGSENAAEILARHIKKLFRGNADFLSF